MNYRMCCLQCVFVIFVNYIYCIHPVVMSELYVDIDLLYSCCSFLIETLNCLSNPESAQYYHNWAPSSEFVSSSIPSWQISTAHAQPFRGARDLVFCLKVPLDSLLVWASSECFGETARMRRFAWTFAARIGDKYQIRLTRSIYSLRETIH